MTSASSVPAELEVSSEAPDRNLALELVRVTEAAAMAAGRWVGRGDKNGADEPRHAMRQSLDGVHDGVSSSERVRRRRPMLYNGERWDPAAARVRCRGRSD